MGVDGKIILMWVLWKDFGKIWIEFIWLRIGTIGVVFLTR
jgi:hypothetical protein